MITPLPPLPVDALEARFRSLPGPRVITAAAGSGKSTRVPLWCADAGRVLVVQPRRVAARSLATFLARTDVGPTVGYAVRGASSQVDARVLFVTPGVALRMLPDDVRFATVVLDEFHERTLDLDLLLALCAARVDLRLVVLSATLAGDAVAAHLGGTHLESGGRTFPIDLRYSSGGRDLPSADDLGPRVRDALAGLEDVPGDRLVFVPGRGEIGQVMRALVGVGDELFELHGSLPLREQQRVFTPGTRRRVIVSTNVAETSVTLPGIGAVVDAGLVRRTHYYDGRGYLLLGPVALDAADQRAGRAGRLGPGVAVRLWGERAPLATATPPEIQRESLVPLVLGAAVAGHPALDLPFLDPPPPQAVEEARTSLRELGALDADGALTERGRHLFRLPLEPHAAHLLVEAEARGRLPDAIDLVAALGVRRPLLRWPRPEPDALRQRGCDATALIRAVRTGEPEADHLDRAALADARREAARLRQAFGDPPDVPFDVQALAETILAAWPRCAHVARRRKRDVAWSNGGTEVMLDRRSAVPEKAEAVLALDLHASGRDRLHRELRITAGLPLTRRQLASLGLGTDRLVQAHVVRGRLVARVERVYAGTVLGEDERPVSGALAREAIAERLLAGQIWKGFARRFARRHRLASLSASLAGRASLADPAPDLLARIERVGLESWEDLALLEPDDLLPESPDPAEVERLEREFPTTLEVGTDRFRVEVRPAARTVELHNLGGRIKRLPPTSWLPGFRGYDVALVDRGVRRWLRRR